MITISVTGKAALLGMVEGLAEFLPISSTGHLILFGRLLQFKTGSSSAFYVAIQTGAMVAVLWVYRRMLLRVIGSLEEPKSQKFVALLLLGVLPAAVAGVVLHDVIKDYLFNPRIVAVALITGGIVMLLIETYSSGGTLSSVDRMSWLTALKIGIFQSLAVVPGVSRSAATIIGGRLSGLDRRVAAEFSFLLAVPTLTGAAVYDLYRNWGTVSTFDLQLMGVGFVFSFVFGLLAIVGLIRVVVTVGFTPFAWYRIILGTAIFFTL